MFCLCSGPLNIKLYLQPFFVYVCLFVSETWSHYIYQDGLELMILFFIFSVLGLPAWTTMNGNQGNFYDDGETYIFYLLLPHQVSSECRNFFTHWKKCETCLILNCCNWELQCLFQLKIKTAASSKETKFLSSQVALSQATCEGTSEVEASLSGVLCRWYWCPLT